MLTRGNNIANGAELPAPLQEAAEIISETWTEAVIIRADRRLEVALRPHVAQYDMAGTAILRWHRDSVLTACRRLVDQRSDARSLRRGLELVRRNASELTEELHNVRGIPSWCSRSSLEAASSSEQPVMLHAMASVARGRQVALSDLVESGGSSYRGRLTRRAVTVDIERLDGARSGPVATFVNQHIAHRAVSIAEADMSIAYTEVDEFLDTVIDIAQRWGLHLDGVHREFDLPALTGTTPLSLALQLFDFRAYMAKTREVEAAMGSGAEPEDYAKARDEIRMIFTSVEDAHPASQ